MQARDHYEAHGWAVLRGVISAHEAATLAALATELAGSPTVPQVWQLPGACRADPALLAHLHGPLAPQVAAIVGADTLRLLQDTLILKPPAAPEVAWHRDVTYTGYLDPPSSLSIRLALTHERFDTGALAVVSGSHRWPVDPDNSAIMDQAVIAGGALARLTPDQRAEVRAHTHTLELAPGDVSLHAAATLHMSHPNASADRTRVTIVTHVFDASSILVAQRLPDHARAAFDTDAFGHLVGPAFPRLGETSH